MSYGLSVVKNNNQQVVIDGTQPLLKVVQSGVVVKTGDSWQAYYNIPRPTNFGNVILFVEWPIGVSLATESILNNTYQIRNYLANGPATLTYHFCTLNPQPSAGGYGLDIYDTQGDLNFSSTQQLMRVREIIKPSSNGVFLGFPYSTTHNSHPNLTLATVPLSQLQIVWSGDNGWGDPEWTTYYATTYTRVDVTTFQATSGEALGTVPYGQGGSPFYAALNVPLTLGPSPSMMFASLTG